MRILVEIEIKFYNHWKKKKKKPRFLLKKIYIIIHRVID